MTSTIHDPAAADQPAAADRGRASFADCGMRVHAVLPPPVTGMTLCTRRMIELVSQHVATREFNWSNGAATIGPWFRVVKALRALCTPWKLIFSRRPACGVFYMPMNAGLAIYFNMLAAIAARLRGYRCAFHHHIYTYLIRRDWRVKLVDRLLGTEGLHVVLCPEMEQRLRELYRCRTPIAIVPSTIQLLQADWVPPPDRAHDDVDFRRFRIGHISNLQLAKGLDVVIAVLRALRNKGRDVQLVLAGPVHSRVEQELIDAAVQEFGAAVEYRGPVYREQKYRFFREIHVKLFPTRYPDAQPLVITESFAFSRPVIAFGRGCIPGMIGPAATWSIPIGADFVAPAVAQIEHWIDDPAAYGEACRLARRRFDQLLAEAQTSLDHFVHWVRGEPTGRFVHCHQDGASTSR